ncbi:hypothetical protein evm_012325 [Chilo suppressalis]|nr:hypothetical protein evm_012325 [Chilo suppressalis]
MEGFIVGGEPAYLHHHPHSAFLRLTCCDTSSWICGASILNQHILLTAAHCIDGCTVTTLNIVVGHRNRYRGKTFFASAIMIHKGYDIADSVNDIGLVVLRTPLNLDKNKSRVAIMKKPPNRGEAVVAGWGKIDDINNIGTSVLMYTTQTVLKRKQCAEVLGRLPRGTICGMHSKDTYVAGGDSGSALVVDDFIQIGLVSHRYPNVNKSIVVYMDVAYHYSWIRTAAQTMFCYLNDDE